MLYGIKKWTIKAKAKTTTSAIEIKFMRIEKYTWPHHRRNEDIINK
jgi:hypothetical protein